MQALKTERQQLENAASKLLSLTLNAGAEGAEVCGAFGQKTKISLEKNDYHMASSDDGYNLGVRAIRGKRQGFACCNTTDLNDLKEIALRAVEIAGFSPENPYHSIKPSENTPKEAPPERWDDALYRLSLQTQKEWTKLMAEEAMKDSRFRLNEGTVSISSGLFLVLNSQGTHKIERETVASWSLMGMGVDGPLITSFDYFTEIARKASTVPERLLESTRVFRDRVLRNLRQGAAHSYKGLVVFSPRAVSEIFLDAISYHLNGRNVVEKTAKWELTHLKKQIFDPSLTVRDLPWLVDRVGCSVFDREGTPTSNSTLIDKGKLQSFLMDHYAAQALGAKSTGNASGGPTSLPSISSHTLCVDGGSEPRSDLMARVSACQKDFLVLQRYSGQVDPVTGDFSGVAKGGEWWHGGERAYCANETLVSGNIFEALGKAIFGVSKETEVLDCGEECPTFVVDGISVTSGK